MWCEGLDLEEWEMKHEYDEVNYLHGCCDDWVNENYKENDKCIAITEYREEVNKICLMHSCLIRDGKYVDVRGETTSFDDVIDGFDYGEFTVETYENIDKFNERMRELGIHPICKCNDLDLDDCR